MTGKEPPPSEDFLQVYLAKEEARAAREHKEMQARIERQNTQEGIRALASKKYTGRPVDYSLMDFMACVETTCRIHEITKDSQKLKLVVSALTPSVQRQWSAQLLALAKENIAPTSEHVFAFLRAQFEPMAMNFEAIERLKRLVFVEDAPGADIVKHNQLFDELHARLKAPLPDWYVMDFYRCTLPYEYQVASMIQKAESLKTVKEAAAFMWNAYSRKQQSQAAPSTTGNRPVEYMDVDRIEFHPSMPCTREDFDKRMRTGECAYCGYKNHTIAQCNYRKSHMNGAALSGNGNNKRRNRNKKKVQVNTVTTEGATMATAATTAASTNNTTPKVNPDQGNF
ncbi:hypothetical protein LPJ73_001248 [Coemansia sp. RSA 2703]|nr:hypothetical protein LPJ73_001248 [Coemansia sp. RSA 2703]KAJ2375493.1 hypothetical protein IW150_002522 [Coemansia sp. RSA 2607]KAJ2397229.1 hypothetical protein GGI05_000744 [Coemansia sp. RSA 2603]